MSEDQPTVTRNDEASRYEIHVGDQLAGFSEFLTSASGRVILPHTSIDRAFAGRGLGKTLVGDMLADLAQRGAPVVPRCTYVAGYLKDHDVAGLIVDWPNEADAQDAATGGESTA